MAGVANTRKPSTVKEGECGLQDQLGVAYIDMTPYRTKYLGIVGKTVMVDVEELHLRYTCMDIEIDKEGHLLGIKLY